MEMTAATAEDREMEDYIQRKIEDDSFTALFEHDYTSVFPHCEATFSDAAAINEISKDEVRLRIHRGQAFTELTNAFLTLNHLCGPVKIDMLTPSGTMELAVDSGGVFKDALSEFWAEFYARCTYGTANKIPSIRDDFTEHKWKSVAKVIYKGWEDLKYFPIKINKAFMEECILGHSTVDIVDTFFYYISREEADILKKALTTWEEVDLSDIMDTLSNYECKRLPTKETFRTIVSELAHKEIAQKPRFVIDCWREILNGLMTDSELTEVYKKSEVTNKNFGTLICNGTPPHMDSNEDRVVSFLKKFVREGEKPLLEKLCRFCTGSDMITCEKIIIDFNRGEGLARSFVGHTCANSLEIPISYRNYQDFRTELKNLLESSPWAMDLV